MRGGLCRCSAALKNGLFEAVKRYNLTERNLFLLSVLELRHGPSELLVRYPPSLYVHCGQLLAASFRHPGLRLFIVLSAEERSVVRLQAGALVDGWKGPQKRVPSRQSCEVDPQHDKCAFI